MNGNLLDTNVIIRFLNKDKAVADYLCSLDNICLSSVVLGELIFGAEKSARKEQNTQNALNFFSDYPVYVPTENDMAVITQDKHFEHIPNLKVIKL